MKKMMSILVSASLLLSSIGFAFALSSNVQESRTLNLKLTTDKNEIELMKEVNCKLKCNDSE